MLAEHNMSIVNGDICEAIFILSYVFHMSDVF